MKLEDRWLRTTDGWFQKLPPVLQAVFIIFGLLGAFVGLIPELQIGLPSWLRILLFGPIIIMLVLEFIPYTLVRWARALSWPFRKAADLLRRVR